MRRDQKIGLFVGMGVILLIGILISDHLSVAQQQQQPQWSNALGDREAAPAQSPPAEPAIDDAQPLAVPGQLVSSRGSEARSTPPVPTVDHEPIILRQDNLRPATALRDERPVPAPGPESSTSGSFIPVEQPTLTRRDIENLNRLPLPSAGTPLPSGGSQEVVHYVKEGETLSQIARQYYGRTTEFHTIYDANRGVISDPDHVSPGTRLVIPNLKPATARPSPAPSAPAAPTYTEYTIKRGETLASVADKFLGSAGKWKQIHELNKDRIKDPNRVSPGTVIRVPRG
jgi:nucleoid-associated protein YgaU